MIDYLLMEHIYSILFVFSIASFYWLAFGRFKRSKNLSGPATLPFVGNYFDFKNANYQLHVLIDKYYKKNYGDVFSFFHYNKEAIVVKDDDLIQQILVKKAGKFQNRQFFVELPWPCNQMITMIKGGATQKYIRYLLSKLTASAQLNMLTPHINKAADSYLQKLEEAAKKKVSIDIESHNQGFKAELLTSTAFSLKCPNQSELNTSLVKLMKDFTNPPTWLHQIGTLPYGEKIIKHMKGAHKESLQSLIDIALGIVEARSKESSNQNYNDILQSLLDAQSSSKGKELLTNEVLLAQGLVLLTAVQTQTSFTLTTVLYNIAKHQHVQERIQKNIDFISNDEGFPSFDHFHSPSLSYLRNVIKESQRLNPSTFMLMRECTESCTIEKLNFSKGDTILIPTHSIHRDEKLWNDALTFNPDRFESATVNKHFYPYGAGSRMCTGSRLAILEITLVLAKILSAYKISLVNPNQELKTCSSVTVQAIMSIIEPINVTVCKR